MTLVHMYTVDQIISDSTSWSNFKTRLAPLTNKSKGDVFERLVQLNLQTSPQYTTKLSDVWLRQDVPPDIKRLLNFPDLDRGIDLIARTYSCDYWSIQAKYRANPRSTLRMGGDGGIAMFTSLSFVTCRNVSFGLICATTNRPVEDMDDIGDHVGFADLSQWIGLDDDAGKGWQRIKSKIHGRLELPKKILPYPFQNECISAAKDYCGTIENSRGKIILPCGTGKSLLGFWISQELGARNVLLVVPSLTLVSQILRTWTEQRVAHGVDLNWFAVCSDGPVGNNRQDQLVSSKYDLGIPRSTDVDEAAAWLSEDSTGTKLTVTTYSSGPALAQAASKVGLSFDLVFMDEAHKTVGDRKKRFGHLLDGSNLLGRNSVTNRVTWERLRGLECDTKVHQRRGQECKFHESLRPPTGGSLPGELSLLRRPNS